VAALAWNGHRAVELALASAAAGIRFVALDPDQHPDAIVRVVDEAGARILFFDLTFMPLVESIAPRLATARCSVALAGDADMPGPAAIPNLRCYEAFLARAPYGVAPSPLPESIGLDLRPEDVLLLVEPLHRREGADLLRVALATPVRRLVLPGPWLDGRSLDQMIVGERVSVTAAPPALWQRLFAHVEREGAGLGHLDRALVTGDPDVAAPVVRTLGERHGVGGIAAVAAPLRGWGADEGQHR
jgi:fatty-acyl-CoA synthase